MAVPAIKREAGAALLAAWPEPSGEAGWAQAARARAVNRLAERGAPGRRDEYWRFTDPTSLTAIPAAPAAARAEDEALFTQAEQIRLVFVDGVFDPSQSDAPEIAGVEIRPLTQALSLDIHWARDLFGVLEARGQTPVDRPFATLPAAAAGRRGSRF